MAARVIGMPDPAHQAAGFRRLSSFIIGVAGVVWAFAYPPDRGAGRVQPRSLVPDPLHRDHRRARHDPRRFFRRRTDRGDSRWCCRALGSLLCSASRFDSGVLDMSQHIVLGALIIAFLIAEPRWAGRPLSDRVTKRLFARAACRREPNFFRICVPQRPESLSCMLSKPSCKRTQPRAAVSRHRPRAGNFAAPLGLSAAQADEQYFPLQSYRVGPYAAGGTGFFGGFIDYLNLINIRDGGVNGVKLTWRRVRDAIRGRARRRMLRAPEEPSRTSRPGTPLSVGIAYAMIDRVTAGQAHR